MRLHPARVRDKWLFDEDSGSRKHYSSTPFPNPDHFGLTLCCSHYGCCIYVSLTSTSQVAAFKIFEDGYLTSVIVNNSTTSNNMASVYKATEKLSKGKKRAAEDEASTVAEKKRKDKVLLLSSRGVTQRMRHLLMDLETLLPHTKKGE